MNIIHISKKKKIAYDVYQNIGYTNINGTNRPNFAIRFTSTSINKRFIFFPYPTKHSQSQKKKKKEIPFLAFSILLLEQKAQRIINNGVKKTGFSPALELHLSLKVSFEQSMKHN